MAQSCFILLILAHTFLTLATAYSGIEPTVAVVPPALSPSNDRNVQTAEAPRTQKLGKHHATESHPPASGRIPSDHHEENGESTEEEGEVHHHHGSGSVDKSMAGGGVILGGLVMAFVVSIVCYIRATRRRSMVEPPTPTTASSV